MKLSDHDGFHASIGRATLIGGALGLAGLAVSPVTAAVLSVAAFGLGLAWPRGRRSFVWATLLALAAGAGATVGGEAGAAAAAIALGLTLARELPGRASRARRALAILFGALGGAGASFVARSPAVAAALAELPSGFTALVGGALGGFLVGLGAVGRHLEIGASVDAAPATSGSGAEPSTGPDAGIEALGLAAGEVGELVRRAGIAYREAVQALGDEAPAAKSAADELVGRVARFGRRWRDVEAEAARTQPEALQARLAEVTARAEASADPVARAEYERAREALRVQLLYMVEIDRDRERAVARLTHQVAMLDRLRLAAVRHRSVDAARLGAELAPLVEEIAQAGGDLDVAAEAMADATAIEAALVPVARA